LGFFLLCEWATSRIRKHINEIRFLKSEKQRYYCRYSDCKKFAR